MKLLSLLAPELILIGVACVLFFLGTSSKYVARRLAGIIAFTALVGVFAWQLNSFLDNPAAAGVADEWNTVRIGGFAIFVKMMVAGVGAILVLLAWPTNDTASGSDSMDFGSEAGEFFALTLLALSGVMLVAGANDLILLFLGIELAAIPTYIMVSISRPLPVAQEAGVKYFFLGALAAGVMLFGFSYIYGTTGKIKLDEITAVIDAARPDATGGRWTAANTDAWLLLGVIILLAGFAFKIAAVPLHAYAGDVYQGAATPVTALLAFVPKTSGFIAIIKLMSAIGGEHWAVPDLVVKTLWAMAVLTMTVGNTLGLLQHNIKRVFAYSSIAHSGYMLVGITALVSAAQTVPHDQAGDVQTMALQGVLFYLLSYGIMNSGAFGILMMLPTRAHKGMGTGAMPPVATTAETFEDLAGTGRKHPWLGLGMAVCCFSLIGLPLTVGFFGKLYLIRPALDAHLVGLVVLTMLNAAVSAAYYLRIVATMFIRPAPIEAENEIDVSADDFNTQLPVTAGVALAVVGTLLLGVDLPFTDALTRRLGQAGPTVATTPAVVQQSVASTPTPASPATQPVQAAAR
jgi:NADH-quinone oxidoreductase subunit N